MPKSERHAVNARLTKAIWERLKAEAEAERRSFGNQVERILAEHYTKQDKEKSNHLNLDSLMDEKQ